MPRKEVVYNRKMITLVIATIAAGIPVATTPVSQLQFTDPAFLGVWALAGIVASFVTYLYFNIRLKDITGVFLLGYMIAVILRFVADILVSNITHANLSLSLLIAMVVGGASGFTGAYIWHLMRRRN
ncbi:MAG: hypothetical protein ACNA78_03180 [Balneolaceae bacterium]